jgi:hypothetical protein
LKNRQVLDLIELGINLFRDLIENLSRYRADSDQICKKLKPKEQCVNGAEMQGFNYNLSKDWTASIQNVKDQNANGH